MSTQLRNFSAQTDVEARLRRSSPYNPVNNELDLRAVLYPATGNFSVVANATSVQVVEPPVDQTWEILFASLWVTSGEIDPADVILWKYDNQRLNIQQYLVFCNSEDLTGYSPAGIALANKYPFLAWPTPYEGGSSSLSHRFGAISGHGRNPVMLRRQLNGASEWRLSLEYTATAAVGTRTIRYAVTYKVRPRV